MPFWKCYYHLVWATRYRQPIITPEREQVIFATIRTVSSNLGSEILAINGTDDHIHIATAIPPGIAVAQWVKRCKGASTREVNQIVTADDGFGWQTGYGVLTFGQKALPYVIAYIDGQKQHHASQQLEPYLEQTE